MSASAPRTQFVANIQEAYELTPPDASAPGDTAPSNADATAAMCSSPSECPRADSPCQRSTCAHGRCGYDPAPDGPLPLQTQGDCKLIVCERGAILEIASPGDPPPDDGKECTDAVCTGTSPEHRAKSVGVSCGDGGVCNASGECGACKANDRACLTGGVPAVCDANGAWVPSSPCAAGAICDRGACVDQPSCAALAPCMGGTLNCCDVPAARGGTVDMGRGSNSDADPAGAALVKNK